MLNPVSPSRLFASPRQFLRGELPTRWRDPFERAFGRNFAHVRVRSGPEIDADLAGQQALGRALDHGRIALASDLRALSEAEQFFVVGHELAHTVQLDRGGCAPVAELEGEANWAAQCALGGGRWTIRLGANQPLQIKSRAERQAERQAKRRGVGSDAAVHEVAAQEHAPNHEWVPEVATNTLAIVNADKHSAAKNYYDTFRYEPSGGILTGKKPEPGKSRDSLRWLTVYTEAKEFAAINLLDVLDWIVRFALVPNGGVVLVCHGDMLGITLPLVKGGDNASIGLTGPGSVIDYLTNRHKNYSVETAAWGLRLTKTLTPSASVLKKAAEQLEALRTRIDGVRRKELRHIAFRACQAGKHPAVLAALKDLFGASRASAPRLRTFFGFFKPYQPNETEWTKIEGLESEWQCYGAKPLRFALRINGEDPNAGNTTVADSPAAVNWFIDHYLPPSNKYRFKAGKLFYQGFWDPEDRQLYFPQEEGYVKNLLYDTTSAKRPYAKLAT